MLRTALPAILAIVAFALVQTSQPRVDATRSARAIDQALLFMPDGETLRLASSGFEQPIANLLWVRSVLTFGDRYQREGSNPIWSEWLGRMILAVTTLDPQWRSPYFYGGSFLRVAGDVAASDRIFAMGHEHLPNDPYFPFSLGMNAYLYRDDRMTAARYLAVAAQLPGAPVWYGSAAAAMKEDAGERATAIRYLEDLRNSGNPGIRADAERQLARLRHNDIVDTWSQACLAWRAANGPLPSPEALSRVGFTLPENPRGDAWIVGADGIVRSEGAEKERVRDALMEEWARIRR